MGAFIYCIVVINSVPGINITKLFYSYTGEVWDDIINCNNSINIRDPVIYQPGLRRSDLSVEPSLLRT